MTLDKKNNPFTYGTDPELNRIFDAMIDLKGRVAGQFAKAEKIAGFTTDTKFTPLVQAKIELPNYKTLREPSSSYYSSKVPMDKVDTQVQAAITAATTHLNEVDALNKPISESNQRIREQVTELMIRLGIPSSYTTYEYPSTRSRTRKSIPHTAGYIGDLQRAVQPSNAASERVRLNSYINDYNKWQVEVAAEEEKAKIERDEATIKSRVLGNPGLVEALMLSGVNILSELATAVPGKKADLVKYCIVKAISNEKSKAAPSISAIQTLEDYHANV